MTGRWTKTILNALIFTAIATSARLLIQTPNAQTARTHIATGSSLPANCMVGDVFFKSGTSAGLYSCAATDTWTGPLSTGGGSGTVTTTGSPSSGDVAKFSGSTSITTASTTGSGSVVLATSPALTTPNLGTPSALTLTNATGLPEGGLTLSNVTTNDASTSQHGFAPKGTTGTTQFWRQDWTLATPGGSGTVTNTGTLTNHALIKGNGGVDVSALGSLGTTTTVLHGNASGDPTFGAVALASDVSGVLPGANGGGLVLLEQHTASSSATLDFTTAISSTYDTYCIRIVGIVPATNNVSLSLQLSSDGGSTWNGTSNYFSALGGVKNDGVAFTFSTNPGNAFTIAASLSNSSTRAVNATLFASAPLSTALDKDFHGTVAYTNQANAIVGSWFGLLTVSGTAFNALRFNMSSGNIASGTIRVYGVAK